MLSFTDWKKHKEEGTLPSYNVSNKIKVKSFSDWKATNASSLKIGRLREEVGIAEETASQRPGVFSSIKGGISDLVGINKSFIKRAFKPFTQPTKELFHKAEEFTSTMVDKPDATIAEKFASGLEVGVAGVETLFTPITGIIELASNVKPLKPAVDLLSVPFVAGGVTGQFISERFIDVLPVSKETKDELRPAFNKLGGLVGSVWMGGKIVKELIHNKKITKEKITELKEEADVMGEITGESQPKLLSAPQQQLLLKEGVKPEVAPTTIPNYKKSNITRNTKLEKGDMVEIEDVGTWIVTDTKVRHTPKGKEQVAVLKDSQGNIFEEAITDLRGSVRITKVAEAPIVPTVEAPVTKKMSFTEWKAQGKPKTVVEQKVATAPETTLETKPAKIAKDIERKAIEIGVTKKFEELAGFEPIAFKQQIERVLDLTTNNFEQAKRIATGKEPVPEGIKGNILHQAVEQIAMKQRDGALIAELAKSPIASEISIAGQTLGAERLREKDSAVRNIREITSLREKTAEKRRPEAVKTQMKKDIKKKVKEEKPSSRAWEKFIDDIIC